MKLLFSFLLLFICLFAYSQQVELPVSATSKKVVYSDWVKPAVKSTRNQLYSRAKLWVAEPDSPTNFIIKLQYQPVCKITAAGGYVIKHYEKVQFYVNLTFEDNKYKYEITDFYLPERKMTLEEYIRSVDEQDQTLQSQLNGFKFIVNNNVQKTIRTFTERLNENK